MLNIPQPIRRQIAATGMMKHSQIKAIFSMQDEDEADEKLLALASKQVNRAEPLVTPWATVAPMLMENVAITLFRQQNPEWGMALPEVLTIADALRIAQADFLLNKTEVNLLKQSLSKPL